MPAGRPKAFDRTQALEAALDVFWVQGYEATSVQDLTDAMGIGRQSVYDTFGDKRALYTEALRHYVATHARAVLGPLADDAVPPKDRLVGLLDQWETFMATPACRGCLCTNVSAEVIRDDPEIAAVLDAHQRELLDALERVIAAGQRDESVRDDMSPEHLGALLAVLAVGFSTLGRSTHRADRVRTSINAAHRLLFGADRAG